MAFSICKADRNIWYGKFDIFPENGFVHGVSTRFGGVSKAPYNTMNLGLHVGDNPEDVQENRRLFSKGLGLDAEKIVTPEQVHGSVVRLVTEADAGRGAFEYSDSIKETDALITNTPGLPILLCYADCTPLIFYDSVKHACGIAHAGWKGTFANIGSLTVKAMENSFGTKASDVLVSIGPAIGPLCYEVSDELAEKFSLKFPNFKDKIVEEHVGRKHLNLWETNRLSLIAAGVQPEHIDMAETCTACNSELFFSYRADSGRTGRIGALAAVV